MYLILYIEYKLYVYVYIHTQTHTHTCILYINPTAHLVAGVLVAAPHNLSLGSEGIRRDFPCAILDEGQNKQKYIHRFE